MEKSPLILAQAFKKAKAINKKILELGLKNPDFKEDVILDILVASKMKEGKQSLEEAIKGQQWYLEYLIELSQLTGSELLDRCYEESFATSASYAEMVVELEEEM